MVIGPCNVVNYILELTEQSDISHLIENEMSTLDIFDTDNIFYLKKDKNYYDEDVFRGPRVGLSLKYPEYLFKEYRFLKQPNKIPKYKNTIVTTLHKNGTKKEDIHKTTGINKACIEKFIKEFTDGKNMSESDISDVKVNKINLLYGYYSK